MGQNENRHDILIVEDSPTQAKRMALILESAGYGVTIAGSADDALDKLRQWKPCMVLSDVMMPGMNGFAFCRRIKEDPHLRHIPVILITYLSDVHDVIQALEAGADNFVMKPYEGEFLLSRVRRTDAACNAADPGNDLPLDMGYATIPIRSSRNQIIEILLSTYETVIVKNRRLNETKDDLDSLNQELKKKIQERSAALKELKEINQELEAFTYSVSHDLRVPLGAIRGYAELMLDSEPDLESRDYARTIVDTADRMNSIIDDLLKLSRITRTEVHRSTVDISGIAVRILSDIRRQQPDRNIDFQVEEGMNAIGDEGLILLALDNLLRNAAKFTDGRELAVIRVGRRAEGAENIFFVSDNGIGFDMQEKEKLFTAFQRLKSAETFPGTGIGLAIVRRVISRHGGKVWAEAAPQKGATFYFTLGG